MPSSSLSLRHTRRSGRARLGRRLTLLIALLAAACAVALGGTASADPHGGSGPPDFGPNVVIFDPTMPTSQIQATVDAIAAQQVDNEMGTQRYALLFKPGTYGTRRPAADRSRSATTPRSPASGASPGDVTINGHVDVYNRCLDAGQLHRARTTSGARCRT